METCSVNLHSWVIEIYWNKLNKMTPRGATDTWYMSSSYLTGRAYCVQLSRSTCLNAVTVPLEVGWSHLVGSATKRAWLCYCAAHTSKPLNNLILVLHIPDAASIEDFWCRGEKNGPSNHRGAICVSNFTFHLVMRPRLNLGRQGRMELKRAW